jgi:hypothetical protein
MLASNDSEVLANAVASLTPGEQEQEEKIQLLKDQQLHEKGEEERKKFSWNALYVRSFHW